MRDNHVICVRLVGELDIANTQRLCDAFVSLSEVAAPSIVVDIAGLTYLDVTGTSVLVATCQRIRSQGGGFSVTNASGSVQRILEVTGLLERLGLPRPRQ